MKAGLTRRRSIRSRGRCRVAQNDHPESALRLRRDLVERRALKEALDEAHQHRGRAAKLLGISLRNLSRLVKKHRIYLPKEGR
jgi:transcriptional regulator with PAS, ATPase and Fis domain